MRGKHSLLTSFIIGQVSFIWKHNDDFSHLGFKSHSKYPIINAMYYGIFLRQLRKPKKTKGKKSEENFMFHQDKLSTHKSIIS